MQAVTLDGIDIVIADDPTSGCSSSLRTALSRVDPRADGIVLMLGDQPGWHARAVAKLIASGRGAPIAVCRYCDGIGHPFWLGRKVFGELAELHGDKGVWRTDRVRPVRRAAGPDRRHRSAGRGHLGRLPAVARIGGAMTRPSAVCSPMSTKSSAASTAHDYLLDVGTASAIYLAVTLGRPLLLEGEPGVGKTTAAKTLAAVLDAPLLRLQCYEGLTAARRSTTGTTNGSC